MNASPLVGAELKSRLSPEVSLLLSGVSIPRHRFGGAAGNGIEQSNSILLIVRLVTTGLAIYSTISQRRWPQPFLFLTALGSLVLDLHGCRHPYKQPTQLAGDLERIARSPARRDPRGVDMQVADRCVDRRDAGWRRGSLSAIR